MPSAIVGVFGLALSAYSFFYEWIGICILLSLIVALSGWAYTSYKIEKSPKASKHGTLSNKVAQFNLSTFLVFSFFVIMGIMSLKQGDPDAKIDQVLRHGEEMPQKTAEAVVEIFRAELKPDVFRASLRSLEERLIKIEQRQEAVMPAEKERLYEAKAILNDEELFQQKYEERKREIAQQVDNLKEVKNYVSGELYQEASYALYSGETEKAQEALAAIQKQDELPSKTKALTAFERGRLAYYNIEYESALRHFEEAVSLDKNNAEYYTWLYTVQNDLGHFEEALQSAEKVYEIEKNRIPIDYEALVSAQNDVATVEFKLGKLDAALENYEEALQLAKSSGAVGPLPIAEIEYNLGLLWDEKRYQYLKSEYYKIAAAYIEKSFKTRLQYLPSDSPQLADAYFAMGKMHLDKKKKVDAYKKALEILERRYSFIHPRIAEIKARLGWDLIVGHTQLKGEDPLFYLQDALAAQKVALPENHPSIVKTLEAMGIYYSSQQELDKAIETLEEALSIALNAHVKDYDAIGNVYYWIAQILIIKGREDKEYYYKALESYEKALEYNLKVHDEDHPSVRGIENYYIPNAKRAIEYAENPPQPPEEVVPFVPADGKFQDLSPYSQDTGN